MKIPGLIVIFLCFNSLIALVGLFYFLLFFLPIRPQTISFGSDKEPFDAIYAYSILGIGLVHLIPNIGFLQRKRWAIIAQKVLAFMHLFAFPIGTVYAMLAFIGLNRPAINHYFNQSTR